MRNNIEFLQYIDQKYPSNKEFPDSFKYDEAMKKVHELMKILQPILNTNLILDQNVQDAYFFTEITAIINKPFFKGVEKSSNLILRFSYFKNMVAAGIFKDGMISDIPKYIKKKIEKQGWRVIRAHWLLNNKYNGIHQYFIDNEYEWWYRFFDYP